MRQPLKQAALALLLIIAIGVVFPLYAWNRTGHKVVSYIAYNRLSSTAKENIGRLLRQHPDFPALSISHPESFSDPTLSAFLEASVWPDRIRDDPRFYDESNKSAVPTPLLPEFPDMRLHLTWHFVDNFFSQDGTPLPSGPPPGDALRQIESIRRTLADHSISASLRAYQLSWLLHIVGDVHQPLHCVARFTQYQRDPVTKKFIGDLGGNRVFLQGGGTLHGYWDRVLGEKEDRPYISATAAGAERETFSTAMQQAPPSEWPLEGFEISKEYVYQFRGRGTQTAPLRLTSNYRKMAERIAEQRVALGGIRLAIILESIFGH